ncbi:MAG: M56 family metallopeptidase [Pseudomonadota bacterium]
MTLLIMFKVALLLSLTLLLVPVLRSASASMRYVVLLAGLTAALLLPVIDTMIPEWQLLPAEARTFVAEPVEAPAAPSMVLNTRDTPAAANPVPATAAAAPTASMNLASAARLVWLGVSTTLLAMLFYRVAGLTVAVRRTRELRDDDWQRDIERCCEAIGVRRRVALRTRSADSMPAVWGVLRPCVLLPENCTDWPAERRRAVLLHELAHVARHDVVISLLVNAACALHWFNPLVWVLKRKLEAEREKACDDMALQSGMSRKLYARQLLDTATHCRPTHSVAPAMAGRSQLEGRIMSILDNSRARSVARPYTQLFASVLMISALLTLSSITFADSTRLWDGITANGDTNPIFTEFAEELGERGISIDDTQALVDALANGESFTRAAAAWALGERPEPEALDALLAAGYDTDSLVRQWVVRSLAYNDDPRVLELLKNRLQQDSDAETRQWSARGLKVFRSSEFTPPLLDALRDSDPEVREWAVRVLVSSSDPAATDAIAALLQIETHPDVAEWAVRSLAGSRDSVSRSALIGALQSPTADVREWAVRSLTIGNDPAASNAVSALLQVETNPDVTEWAIRSLSGRSDPQSRSAMITALQSPTTDVREWAARGLAGSTDPDAVSALISALGDSADDVREWSIRSLGVCGNTVALAPLEAMRNDPSDEISEWAGRSIRQIRCES